MPKVSVIVPTYNRSDLVKETIASVLQQTFDDLELIVVDDGSTDDTRSVVESIEDARVKYYYKNNGGCASARNLGLSKSCGQYIAFLDSDDFWPQNFLETLVTHLEKQNQYGAVYSPITKIYPDGRKTNSYNAEHCKSGWVTVDLFKKGFVCISAAVFRRSICENFHFDESFKKSYEDFDALLRLSVRTQFFCVKEVEAFYRVSPDSISVAAGINCTKILVLERFYFRLGGDKIVPGRIAKRKISHVCRKVAKARYQTGNRAAAIFLCQRAISYWPLDIRLYVDLLKSLLVNFRTF